LVLRTKKDLSYRTLLIDNSFREQIEKEEIEFSVKNVVNSLLNDVCCQFNCSRGAKRKLPFS